MMAGQIALPLLARISSRATLFGGIPMVRSPGGIPLQFKLRGARSQPPRQDRPTKNVALPDAFFPRERARRGRGLDMSLSRAKISS